MPTPRIKLSTRESSHHASSAKTKILINVYDLLPPGKLASALWTLGSSLLHTGIVIKDREYAYGGHDRPGVSGVYWTKPRLEPPGGTFRCELIQGYTSRSEEEIEALIYQISQEFLGTSYNLLSRNCNHFTAYLCYRLVRKSPPSWVNRAANIGLVLPCIVPKEWISSPDCDTVDGELLVEDVDDDEEDENAAML